MKLDRFDRVYVFVDSSCPMPKHATLQMVCAANDSDKAVLGGDVTVQYSCNQQTWQGNTVGHLLEQGPS
jgi:hypothetical protein